MDKFRIIKILLLMAFLPMTVHSQTIDSLAIKAGQMIMIGLPGNSADLNSSFYADIKDGKVGGVLIYEKHLTPSATAENLTKMIGTYQAASPIPLFVSIDQEGGIVNRLKTKYGFPPMPSAAFLGRVNNIDTTKHYADNIASTLSSLGINLNYAPVLDVYKASNPVLGSRQRCFSADPKQIIIHARQTILSHNACNVNSMVKHFPGHGSSTADSHLGVVDVSRTWKEEELDPYKVLIKEQLVEAVMTAHIVNAQLDEDKIPATLSKKILTDLLRNQLLFDGVIFSDDMHMKAISARYGFEESIEMAINAGVDVLMFSNNFTDVGNASTTGILQVILNLVTSGKVSEERINDSFTRIMRMKNNRHQLSKASSSN